MNRGIYAAASAMGAAEKRVEAITANLANVGATGFKRKGLVTHSFQSALRPRMQPQITVRESLDTTQGSLRHTGGEFDLAIEGRGFFAVDTPDGEIYTRNGAFHVDPSGVLQTREGLPVAWEGSRGTLDPLGSSPVIDSQGNVRQDGSEIGRLKLVDFDRPNKLSPDVTGGLRAGVDLVEQAPTGSVRQGMLEMANVNAVDEMVSLIAAQRSFESAARTLSSIEQVMRRLTNSR